MTTAHQAPRRHFALALGLLLPVVNVTVAFAQNTGAPAGGSGPAGGAGPGGGGQGGQGGGGQGGAPAQPAAPTVTTQYFPGGVAPPPPGGTLGGGNAQFSSSKPITGNERDTFDFKRSTGGGTVRGGENSSFIVGSGSTVSGAPRNASLHVVRKGDTLSSICDSYFDNPHQWPRIWSYNPQIQNPHWIFPGDQVHLKPPGVAAQPTETATGSPLIDRRRQVPPQTIFLRNRGYIEDNTKDWGEITGSPEDKMILSDFDDIYVKIGKDHDIKLGQELTIYRPTRSVAGGKLIEIQGTARVEDWNSRDRIARAKITESLDTIERGARVGPIGRRFEVIPPVPNETEVTAYVLTSIHSQGVLGQNQVVFIDKGEAAGLKPGNTLVIIRKGDGYHATQTTGSSALRIALEDDSPAAVEDVPKPRDASVLPENVIAELRIINVRKNTAMALVTRSRSEIESGDRAVARKGP